MCMYHDKIALTMQNILEKEFKVDARGYRMQEVDQFLDIIIRDYNEYNNIIFNLCFSFYDFLPFPNLFLCDWSNNYINHI